LISRYSRYTYFLSYYLTTLIERVIYFLRVLFYKIRHEDITSSCKCISYYTVQQCRKRSKAVLVRIIFTSWACCWVELRGLTSILASLQLWCRPAVWSAGSTVCSGTLATVCSGTFVVDPRFSSGCTAWRRPGALPAAAISSPILSQSPATPSAPWWPSAGQRRTAPRCLPCTCSTRPRFFRRCLWPGTPGWVPATLGPAEMCIGRKNKNTR